MKEDIAQIRRANLKAWVEVNGTPQKERSFFSQLVLGDCSFGERAARRIEHDYNMAPMYLDTRGAAPAAGTPPQPEEPAAAYGPPEDAQESFGRTVLARLDMEELELVSQFREKTRRGKEVIWAAVKTGEKQSLTGLRAHNKG
jgi:hypothetical protein